MSGKTPLIDRLRDAANWPFSEGAPKRLGVAVSGGGDSMALLDLMLRQGGEAGVSVEAVTVDHGLRPEARDEAAMVEAFCSAHGASHSVLHWDGWDGRHNLQAQARKARYELIADWATRSELDCVALGHTRDDVAETFLMRLSRAAGVDGLAAMEQRFDRFGVTWIRPLLRLRRGDLRDYLKACGISWAEDASNEDERFDRVKARKILAALEPLGIDAESLGQTSDHLHAARRALQHYTCQEAEQRIVLEDRGDLILTFDASDSIPDEIMRRLLVAGIQWVSGAHYPPRNASVNELDAAIARVGSHTLGGCVVSLDERNNRIRIAREWNAVKDAVVPSSDVWDGRWRLAGPCAPDLEIRALGAAGLESCCDWRDSGMPRTSLLASPAVWRGKELVSAPVAGYAHGWKASLVPGRGNFCATLLSH